MSKIIYLDTQFMCHPENDDSFELLTSIETDVFDNYCDEYIKGYRFVPEGYTWTREDGIKFNGEMIAPAKNWKDLIVLQHITDQEALSTYKDALNTVGITV